MATIHQQIINGFDHIISERGNTYISLRKVKWTEDSEVKLDLRKYVTKSDGTEQMMRGCSFDDEAANELTRVLVDTGYGNTRELIDSLRQREDFNSSYEDSINGVSNSDTPDTEYFDIRSEMLG